MDPSHHISFAAVAATPAVKPPAAVAAPRPLAKSGAAAVVAAPAATSSFEARMDAFMRLVTEDLARLHARVDLLTKQQDDEMDEMDVEEEEDEEPAGAVHSSGARSSAAVPSQ